MSDDRDFSWLTKGMPPAPNDPERLLWRVEKDIRWAEARVRMMAPGPGSPRR